MATIGLSKPYFAIYNENNGAPTYSGGGTIGKYTEFSLELDDAEANILYADNGPAESDNQFTGGTANVTTDDLRPEPMMAVLGLKAEQIDDAEGAQWIVFDDDQAIPYIGLGGVVKKKVNNTTMWQAFILTKVQFANPGLDAVTQGETIEWQTPSLSATVMRDDGPKHRWFMLSTFFQTEADAEAAIKAYLNITDPTLGSLTVNSAAGTESGDTKLTVTPQLTSGNHYVYQTGATVTLPTTYGQDVSSWTAWNGTDDIAATTGNEIGVVEADSNNGAVKAGKATVTAAT